MVCPYPDCGLPLTGLGTFCHGCRRYVSDYGGGDRNRNVARTRDGGPDVAEGGGEKTSAGTVAPSPKAYTIPLPPSVNRMYRTVARIKGMQEVEAAIARRDWAAVAKAVKLLEAFSTLPKSAEGKLFVQQAREWLAVQGIRKIADGPVALRVTFYLDRRGSDLDNRLKPFLDVLEGYVYTNDRQIEWLATWKRLDRERPRAVFSVEPGDGPPDPFEGVKLFNYDLPL